MNKEILKKITYGIYLVSAIDKENKKVGCIINTLNQIASPNMISISLNKNNYTTQAIKETKKFAVSIISEKTPQPIIAKFGYKTSTSINKYENTNYTLIENIPIVKEETTGYLIAKVKDIIDLNTHNLIIAEITNMQKINDNIPMTYSYYHENLKGTSPKNAPTYIEEETTTISPISSQYKCKLCGYIYDDAKEEIKFEDLPDNWQCPLCGATKDQFEKIN